MGRADDPLDANTNNGVFASGDILWTLAFQSNLDGLGISGSNPCGPGASQGAADKGITANLYADSTDILSLNPNHTAMALTIADIGIAPNSIEVRVFEKNEVLLGEAMFSTTLPGTFIGFVMKDEQMCGRINLWPTSSMGTEFIYEAMAYENPPPCAADLNGDGLVNSADLTILLGARAAGNANGDIDGAGDADSANLTLLLGAWAAGGCERRRRVNLSEPSPPPTGLGVFIRRMQALRRRGRFPVNPCE